MGARYTAGLLALLMLLSCGDASGPQGPFDLTIVGASGLVGAYAGKPVHFALVDEDGAVVARASAAVATSGTSAFAVGLAAALEAGASYDLFVWLDADAVGAGAPGACDDIDPQWHLVLENARSDREVELPAGGFTAGAACDAFTVPLTFEGSAAFRQFGGTNVVLELRDVATGAIREAHLDVVSPTATPSFTHTFGHELVVGRDYEVVVWIDANVGGGEPGVCDDLPIDRKWRIALNDTGEEAVQYELTDGVDMTETCPAPL